jgi:hypothetical protein
MAARSTLYAVAVLFAGRCRASLGDRAGRGAGGMQASGTVHRVVSADLAPVSFEASRLRSRKFL